MTIAIDSADDIRIIAIDRPDRRNAVDAATAEALHAAFLDFESDADASVAILTGSGGQFCAGADLKALAGGEETDARLRIDPDGGRLLKGPMGPTRMLLSKPVIAAVEGHAVAGGLELACWCDLRVAAETAVFGVFCRRFGVPLVDMGTIRLPRLIGHSQAMDMILTGRAVDAAEAARMGLVNRVVPEGQALEAALDLARRLAALPQRCLRNDRLSAIEQWDLPRDAAMSNEVRRGVDTLASGETQTGASAFSAGAGRHGSDRS